MKRVRPITWLGFVCGLIAIASIGTVNPYVSMALGAVGIIVSVIALATSK